MWKILGSAVMKHYKQTWIIPDIHMYDKPF